ncbi:unnamed protein product [Rhizoctonia solani]|uniref:Uncharacterized protein n=1 Tax=Rhizoctonia solani TaxID=456999 RepID=A0A8H3DH96_9AGAM|nr:unnamed protein product [Rhizoctonia solani]
MNHVSPLYHVMQRIIAIRAQAHEGSPSPTAFVSRTDGDYNKVGNSTIRVRVCSSNFSSWLTSACAADGDVAKFPYSGPLGHVTLQAGWAEAREYIRKEMAPPILLGLCPITTLSSYTTPTSSDIFLPYHYLTSLAIMSSVSIPISGASAAAASNLSTPASSPGNSSGLLIYTREELLSLASSPLSQTPPDSAAFSDFPATILRANGNGLSNAALNDAKYDSDKEEAVSRLGTSQQFELELE